MARDTPDQRVSDKGIISLEKSNTAQRVRTLLRKSEFGHTRKGRGMVEKGTKRKTKMRNRLWLEPRQARLIIAHQFIAYT
ncbi:hypothetical protein NL53_02415 [Vibrio variabilis]|uniref:50S ribosomal protein L35 n=1 Tax=Vibrio variabilis TaxID=990271 RepID=A0ABR4YFW2_9VIBR|nr:hypothetical protein NL53_02415 [Vibrio variabilis]